MRIGIDLGGTKIEGILLASDGQERARKRVATPRGDYAGTLNAISLLVSELTPSKAEPTIGVGTPGALSQRTGLMKNANSTWLNGRPFRQDLEAKLGREIRMSNDANCFALSEAVDGAGAEAESVFGVILGTGAGGGFALRQQIHLGANTIAGEWGHNPLPWPKADEVPGPLCYCGQRGCLETYVSGPGLTTDHQTHTGVRLSAEEILTGVDQEDETCVETWGRYRDRLARGLSHVINLLDPEVIVLGGGLSKISRIYKDVPELWASYVFSDVVETKLLPPAHGDASGVRGAAWLWPTEDTASGPP